MPFLPAHSSIPHSRARLSLLLLLSALIAPHVETSTHAQEAQFHIDFSASRSTTHPNSTIRPLHGINKGPIAPGGIFDVIREQKALGIPYTRLHDCGWPNPYVVDHHAVFPNPNADPSLPESYDFKLTDEYIAAVRATAAEPIYRLGESIEHTTVKRYVHPPANPEKWAAICIGIIRHYNEGWANGFHHGIRYWEIWNEPENRPVMWTGTDDDYLKLYRTAATAIHSRFPNVKVGGPSLGASGSFVAGKFVPTPFAERFLTMCHNDQVPLHFFSWHCYTANPSELSTRSHAIRHLLTSHGLPSTESHLNEWNYLPENNWGPLMKNGNPKDRQSHYAEMAGPAGAAFIVTSLIELQDAPVDVCNFYHGELGGFGIFTEQGVPLKAYQALRAFQGILETPQRAGVVGGASGKVAILAGLSRNSDGITTSASMLIANFADPRSEMVLNWKGLSWSGGVLAEMRRVDGSHDFSDPALELGTKEDGVLRVTLKAPSVALIRLTPK